MNRSLSLQLSDKICVAAELSSCLNFLFETGSFSICFGVGVLKVINFILSPEINKSLLV